MDRAKVFATVKGHLLTQNRSAEDELGCQYQTSDGLRCAIGCLIPDQHPGLEHRGNLNSLLSTYPDLKSLWAVNYSDIPFLQSLQRVHDIHLPQYWSHHLNLVKEKHLEQA